MPTSTPTTGLNVDVVVALDTDPSHAFTLSLSGNNGPTTHQLTATLKDIAGNAQTPTQSFSYISRNPAVATVSASGLITAVSRGFCFVEAAYPFGNNLRGTGPDGLPVEKVYNEVRITVLA
jgi:hypothetical protein